MNDPIVLFATDLEGDVAEGLSVASRLAAERAATLLVVHVAPLRAIDGEGMLHSAVDLMSGDRRERDLRALSPPDPRVPHRSLLLLGEPEDELARVAKESGASFIVMEARRRGPVERLLEPGLIARLTARVGCPVVTYRARPVRSRPRAADPVLIRPQSSLAPSLALQVVLDARVDALLNWLDARVHAVTSVARLTSIQNAVASLAATRTIRPPVRARQVRDELVLELGEHLRAARAVGVEVWFDDTRSPKEPILSLGVGARSGSERDGWIDEAMRDGAAVSLPIDSAASDEAPIVLAVARIPLSNGVSAALAFAFDARRGFLRILAQPGPASSAETYAFDGRGVMLSSSRFPEQLRSAGLLAPAARTSRRMRLCDPGVSLLDSRRPASTKAWPLTRMAASATAGHDGVDVRGYRDYRGVPVIGAWRWIPQHRFGVAAEMDIVDAGVAQLRRAS
ncbi:MAG: universal stress protein [Sandaracinaceae bacterium]|nr:universal stress protein [Sandaracinaceae bacterium]